MSDDYRAVHSCPRETHIIRTAAGWCLIFLLAGCRGFDGSGASNVGGNGSTGGPAASSTSTGAAAAGAGSGAGGAPIVSTKPASGNSTADRVFRQQCANCHSVEGIGKTTLPLDGLGNWHDSGWIQVQVRHPEKHDAHTRMPSYPSSAIPDSDLKALCNYLASLKTPPKAAGT